MKKNIIKIVALSVLSLGTISTLNSCRDAIYIEQDGEVNEEVFFSSVDNLQKFLQGSVYRNADNTYGVLASSIITDEVKIGGNNGGAYVNEFRHILDVSNDFSYNIWLSNYRVINSATRLIEGAKKVTPASSELATYNKVLAEAKTMRALAYLQLQTYFSEDMTNDAALGVMIVKDVPTTSTQLPRSTNAEVYAEIEADLTFAEAHLPASSRYYASKDLVNAIKARLNLYRGKFADAKRYAEAVVGADGLRVPLTPATPIPTGTPGDAAWNTDFYKDASTSPYRQMLSDNTQGEVIFALSRPVTGSFTNIGSNYHANNSTINGSPLWEMGLNLYNILDTTPGDIRKYAYIDPTSVSGRYIIDKYPGKGTQPLRNDIKLFRASEMYLIIAEAEAEAGNNAVAADWVKKVRDARTYIGTAALPSYGSKQAALEDILKERRVELAFEGHRLIDLKRLAARAGVTMDRNIGDDLAGQALRNLPNGSHFYTLPIPSAEIAGNKNIKQNNGYN